MDVDWLVINQWSSSLELVSMGGSGVKFCCYLPVTFSLRTGDIATTAGGTKGAKDEEPQKRKERKKEKKRQREADSVGYADKKKTVMERYENGKVTLPLRNRIYSSENKSQSR